VCFETQKSDLSLCSLVKQENESTLKKTEKEFEDKFQVFKTNEGSLKQTIRHLTEQIEKHRQTGAQTESQRALLEAQEKKMLDVAKKLHDSTTVISKLSKTCSQQKVRFWLYFVVCYCP
jgi:arginine utilization protein RocB